MKVLQCIVVLMESPRTFYGKGKGTSTVPVTVWASADLWILRQTAYS